MNNDRGRFAAQAGVARARPPHGVNARQGQFGLGIAAVELVALAVAFQAQNLAWGGLLLLAANIVALAGICALAALVARSRRVHPRGHQRALIGAGVWGVAVVAAAGWFWVAQGPHEASPLATTIVAMAAVLPLALTCYRLVQAARLRRTEPAGARSRPAAGRPRPDSGR